jgi:hypothetical protein
MTNNVTAIYNTAVYFVNGKINYKLKVHAFKEDRILPLMQSYSVNILLYFDVFHPVVYINKVK